jgi:hypothetical protein
MRNEHRLTKQMQDLIEKYPYLKGREDPLAHPKHKIVVRMLDRHINADLNGKPGIKPDRKEELTVTVHTAGQDVLWTLPIISALEDELLLKEMDPKEAAQLQFVYSFDNGLE